MLSKHSKLAISCGNNVITSKTVIRYLGVDLEQTLSGTAIVENILKKGNSRLKLLYRQAKYMNTRSRKLLTSALILCHFDYACSAWYSVLQKNMKHKLQILQNNTIRFALDLSPRTHLDIIHFLKMQWLPVDVRAEQLNLNSMAELHVILLRVLVWSVRCMMLRQDIERCLSPCHPLGETDLRLLN